MTKSSENVRRMVLCAMFTALVAVCSQIAVPLPWGVPINLALFAIHGGHDAWPCLGYASVVVFIALAAIGVPDAANLWRPVCHLRQDWRGCAIGYILIALMALLTKALGRKFWSLCVADGRRLRRLLPAGHDLVHDPDRG